jgi:hypothetical protein
MHFYNIIFNKLFRMTRRSTVACPVINTEVTVLNRIYRCRKYKTLICELHTRFPDSPAFTANRTVNSSPARMETVILCIHVCCSYISIILIFPKLKEAAVVISTIFIVFSNIIYSYDLNRVGPVKRNSGS